jgi:BirA family biotin operon repressor/biotin-[acetyl-CoA-carboxylase] ligase
MSINWILERVEESASTNEDLLSRWREGALWEPIARLAAKQFAGRGRMGRSWISNPNQALTFSVAYPFKKPIAELSGLSLACGLGVIKGISQGTGIAEDTLKKSGLGLKWPNDILLGDAKLGGMLIEGGQINATQPTWLVIGIGINLTTDLTIEKDIGRSIAGINQITKASIDPEVLWLSIINELGVILETFEKSSFKIFKDKWNEWDIYKNQVCQISQQDKIFVEGIEHGVDDTGHLLIETANGIERVISGDVSLRKSS